MHAKSRRESAGSDHRLSAIDIRISRLIKSDRVSQPRPKFDGQSVSEGTGRKSAYYRLSHSFFFVIRSTTDKGINNILE